MFWNVILTHKVKELISDLRLAVQVTDVDAGEDAAVDEADDKLEERPDEVGDGQDQDQMGESGAA